MKRFEEQTQNLTLCVGGARVPV